MVMIRHAFAEFARTLPRRWRIPGFALGILMVHVLAMAPEAGAGAPLERSGRWFRRGGNWLYMVGVDMQSLVGARAWKNGNDGYDGDYVRILDELKRARVNKVRLWANIWFLDPDLTIQPYKRTKDGRYDLTAWNPVYWRRLRDFVRKADERGILVEYCLFAQYAKKEMVDGRRPGNYWAARNNVNGAFRDVDHTPGLFLEFYDDAGGRINGHSLSWFQDRLVQKAIDEIGGFGNVFFLILNEPYTRDPSAFRWMRERAAAVKRLARVSGRPCLVAVNTRAGPDGVATELHEFWDDPDIDIIGGNAYQTDPARLSAALHLAQDKGKVLADSEGNDLRSRTAAAAREAWGWAMAGGYYSFFTRDRDFNKVGDATWRKVIRVATTLRNVFESVPFWRMSPVDDGGRELDRLVHRAPGSGGAQVFANPGEAYIVYTWGRPTTRDLSIDLQPGRYGFQWLDVRDGAVTRRGEVSGGLPATIPAPPDRWDGRFGLAAVIRRRP